MTAEVIVPWRRGDSFREAVWEWLRPRLEGLGWPVVVAEHGPGPWVKASAVMPAVEASTADVVVVHDADVWVRGLPAAVAAVEAGAPWAMPHLLVRRLSRFATERVLAGENPSAQHVLDQPPYPGVMAGGAVVLRRDVALDVPMDHRYVGWGQEDHCLPAGVLVSTEHGEQPIESVRVGDRVLTRGGWRRVTKSGVTGWTDRLVLIEYPVGWVLCTPSHPVLVDGRFVPAQNVRPGSSLVVNRPSASTDGPWHGGDAGGIGHRTGATATAARTASVGPRDSSSTEQSTKSTSAPFLKGSRSTTSAGIAATTDWRICDCSRHLSIRKGTVERMAPAGYRGTFSVAANSPAPTGNVASRVTSSVLTAGRRSLPSVGGLGSARVVASRLIECIPQPVYNLTVDEHPEFFANGALVHNSWGYALATLHGDPWRAEDPLFHLWHPPPDRIDRFNGSYQSQALYRRYFAARNDRPAMRALVEEARRWPSKSPSTGPP